MAGSIILPWWMTHQWIFDPHSLDATFAFSSGPGKFDIRLKDVIVYPSAASSLHTIRSRVEGQGWWTEKEETELTFSAWPTDEFFWFFLIANRQNAHVARELFVDEPRLLQLSTYSPARYTKILFHGFTNDVVSEFVIQTRNGISNQKIFFSSCVRSCRMWSAAFRMQKATFSWWLFILMGRHSVPVSWGLQRHWGGLEWIGPSSVLQLCSN
jgi:hypothetical protein